MLGLMAAAPWGARAGGEDAVFLSGIEDLPLMAGLVEDMEAALVFDSAGGRYVEAFAEGAASLSSGVAGFYDAALPQLGWQKNGILNYSREGESLSLEIINGANGGDPVRVHFILSPIK